MNTSFTSKQREVLARKLGYDGPMQGFDEFLQSSPALMMKYNAVSDKFAQRMAKGGVVGYAEGGGVPEKFAGLPSSSNVVFDGKSFVDVDTGNKYDPATTNTYYDPVTKKATYVFNNTQVNAPAPAPTLVAAPAPSPTQTPRPIDGVGPMPQNTSVDSVVGGGNSTMSAEDARSFFEEQRTFAQQSDANLRALPEVQALESFTQTVAGRQPTPQEMAKAQELGNAVQNSPAFKAIRQEQQDYGKKNKQKFDALDGFLRQNPDQFETVTGQQQLRVRQGTSIPELRLPPAPVTASAPSPTQTPGPVDGVGPLQNSTTSPSPSPSPAPAPVEAPAPAPVSSPAPAPTGSVTGGGGTTFEETEGRAGVPKPGDAATVTSAKTAITPEQSISGTGGAGTASEAKTTQAGPAAQAAQPTQITAKTAEATGAAEDIKTALEETQAAQGTVSEQAQVSAQQGYVSPESIAKAAEAPDAAQVTAPTPLQMTEEQKATAATVADVGGVTKAAAETTGKDFKTDAAQLSGTPEATAATNYTLPEAKSAAMNAPKVMDAAKAAEIPSANTDQTTASSTAVAQQRAIAQEELVDVSKQSLQITEPVQAVAATMDKLNDEAKMIAQQGSFSQALAEAQTGTVEAASTVAGQLEKLMAQFNNGTPAWAAGAIRNANAAMAARGLGGSSMAGAAIVQAAMEAALPIAAKDAETFATMGLQNLNNRQAVSLANAAANQKIELENLNNRQAAALANSTNAFALQSASLSNTQAVVLANANIKAAVAEKNLDVKTQTALTNAARFAEVNNINLSNAQQAVLQRSSENLQVEFTNLSARQQTALANLQVRAAVTGQELTNEQQMAMLQSTQNFEAAGIEASNKQQAFIQDFQARAALTGQVLSNQQQTALFNVSSVLQERNINLTNEQQTRLFNTTNSLQVEMANLSNKQQTALANAQIEAALKGQELTNKQQVNITNAARVAEIANVNFTAAQQNALANAQFIQQINLADLNNEQASVLANAATYASMDMANLNNRQQAAVMNAQNFLAMDMANLDKEQQTTLFKGQQLSAALLSDAAAENAMKQFNASSQNQVDQFMVSLSTTVSQFNASQKNAIDQFNTDQANAVSKFNTEQTNARAQFNANQRLVIDQSNAQWRREVSTADTAAANAALYLTAQNMQQMTLAEYNNETQLFRDQMEKVWSSFEKDQDRITTLASAEISAKAVETAASTKAKSDMWTTIGEWLAKL
jgi:hypothetical protein